MDSWKIAAEIEKRHPTPSLHLDSAAIQEAEQPIMNALTALRPVVIPQVPRNVLRPRSEEFFEQTRKERYGMPLSEVEKTQGGEQAWQAADQPLKDTAAVIKKQGGPYVLGKTRESLLERCLWGSGH